jgi:hypothetical protein
LKIAFRSFPDGFAEISCETKTLSERTCFIAHDFDQTMLPARDEQLAIQAKLNMLLGAEIYDALFLGFECGVIFEDVVHVYVPGADAAVAIGIAYPQHVARAVASVMKLPIRDVHVLPRNYSDV